LYKDFKDDGLVVLGVHAWTGRESKADVEAFVKEFDLTYPVLLGGLKAHRELYKCEFVPRVFFIDRKGRIAATELGFEEDSEEKFEQMIKGLL
jgi:hypothetical protein